MSLTERKLNIIKRISEMEDANLLKQIQNWLDFELDESIYKLSKEETHRIQEAKEEYRAGKTITEEQANTEIKKWLDDE